MLKRLLTKRWILTTILVIAGVLVCIRLGIWQLDRLAGRKSFNARVETQLNALLLDLNLSLPSADQLYNMEYRTITVVGIYDAGQEIVLRNQDYNNQLGDLVLTPLKITGSSAILLVERGWIPYEDAGLPAREKYAEPGQVTVTGILRRQVDQPNLGGVPNPTLAPGETHLDAWNYINLDQIQKQNQISLLPVYVQQAPDPAWTQMPYRQVDAPDITEGPHLGYAIQWFIFATILGAGYPFFLKKQLGKVEEKNDKTTWVLQTETKK